jgi:amino acid adenylation domain-containing protein
LLLRAKGIDVTADGERLRIEAAPGALDPELAALLRARSAELVSYLRLTRHALHQRSPAAGESRRGPLATTQRRLWLFDRTHFQCSAYNVPYAIAWDGALDVPALQISIRALFERHDALQMQVLEDGADACAEVTGAEGFAAEVIDLSSDPDALQQRLDEAAARPFDLTKDRLFRASLFRLGPERHILFLNVHHFVCDGSSLAILLDELSIFYAAHARARGASLPPISRSFFDYARSELARLETDESKRELRSAVGRLEGLEPLELPTDRPRPALFSHRGAICSFTFSRELSASIKALAGQLAVTPYLVLLTAYELLLSRYSGQRDLAVAIPIDGRGVKDASLVGFFAKTLVLRTDLGGTPSFSELVARVKASRLAAFAAEHVPFEHLVEALDAAQDRSRTPIFQALFSLEEARFRMDPVTGQPWRRVRLANGGAKTDLTLVMEHDHDHFLGELEYCTDLFDRHTIQRLLKNFETLLESVVRDPHAPAMRARMLHSDDLAALDRINETRRELPVVGGFYELIREQARLSPSRVAIRDQHGNMSYDELDGSSDAWAARLAASGVTRGARVGVAVGRSRRVLEVNLGVMKAGAAYVPLDTSFPRDRLAFMARDAELTCIVAERAAVEALPEGVPLLIVEELERTTAPAGFAQVVNEPSDVAYIIYTSGSTGLPKGVEVLHGGVSNLLNSMSRAPGCGPDDRVMAVSTFSFDMCIAELYLPLVVGACTIIAPRTCAADGETLARVIDDYGATFVQATPTTFKLLVEAGLPEQPFKAIGGGEPFPAELARALSRRCSEVWNGYGPTETTVYATFYRIEDPDSPVLIGRPIENTKVYVLDSEQQRVPFGVVGELYIGGAGVSRGYRNCTDLTRARFLRDPFSDDMRAMMYRTGDLVRARADGLQYLGRTDSQVKLRGYRIELGEIESLLLAHESVEQAVVLIREFGPNDQRLVAYVTGSEGLRPAALRAYLGKQLPRYMVPRLIVALSSMPMTPSGKIDRILLPDPRGLAQSEDERRPVSECATERVILEIWQRVLGTPDVGVDDDFFAAGGHSLLAVQLVREINRALHTRLSLGVIFEAPTIRAQAARVDRGEHGGGVSIVLLNPGGRREPLFCICGINLYQSLATELAGDRPVYGLYLPIEGELLERATVELDPHAMAKQYLEAIRSVQTRGPYHLAGVSFGGALAYEIARQIRASGEQVGMLALLDTILPSALPASRMRQAARAAASWARSNLGPLASVLDAAPSALKRAVGVPKLATEEVPGRSNENDTSASLAERTRRYQQAMTSYEPSMLPYDGDVVLVRALDQFRQLPGCAPDYGWSKYVRGELEMYDLPGDHLGILTAPHVREVARWITGKLARSDCDDSRV